MQMQADSQQAYLQALGARILSEANDLKRTAEALASDLGIEESRLDAVLAGRSDLETARGILRAMAEFYPVSLADLWIDQDDTDHGVRIVTSDESIASSRVFSRKNREGGLSPYYEYRDTAMSRTAPFKPEWIKELRVVRDADPANSDVAFNNGHLMHQGTFFLGPVNFYWQIDGEAHCAELNTGDSNYITPFVPHSFASRDADNLGVIIAVTYGGEVRRSLSDFGRLDADQADRLVADPRRPDDALVRLIARHAADESLTNAALIDRLTDIGIERERANGLVSLGGANSEELESLASALNVRPVDMTVVPLESSDEVVVQRRGTSLPRLYPNDDKPAYEITELARAKHQQGPKGFDFTVLGGAEGDLQHSLHEYVFNYGQTPVNLKWGDADSLAIMPGDSAYVRPMTRHRFSPLERAEPGHLVVMRVPGGLSAGALSEFSTFAPDGRGRVIAETKRWF